MSDPVHQSDQWIAGWMEHGFPILERVYDAVLAETGDPAFATEVAAWFNRTPAAVAGTAADVEAHRDLIVYLEACAAHEVCAVYKRWMRKLRSKPRATRLAIAFLEHRYILTKSRADGR